MLVKTTALILALVSVALAQDGFIGRTPPVPGGCQDNFRLKKGCGVNGTDICCPIKMGRPSVINIDLGVKIGVDVKVGAGSGKDKDSKEDKKEKERKEREEDKKWKAKNCVPPAPAACATGYFGCPDNFGGDCCPEKSLCGTVGPKYGCFLP
ncbi:hypothetical protein B0O80DRAFT_472580 [Mortierella sp. GBAus27b]|nr:hypothetical protein B0O80DRAFT_472580 [Mortierella sp. GBAus27b]